MVNLRKSTRRIFRAPAELSMAAGHVYAVRSYDLGAGGMCVITPVHLEAGSQGMVSFELPSAAGQQRIRALAHIVYCLACVDGFKTGLQFADLDATTRPMLLKFLGEPG